jgi:hypothetical protein
MYRDGEGEGRDRTCTQIKSQRGEGRQTNITMQNVSQEGKHKLRAEGNGARIAREDYSEPESERRMNLFLCY